MRTSPTLVELRLDAPPLSRARPQRLPPGRACLLPSHFAALRDKLCASSVMAGTLSFGDPRVNACLPMGEQEMGLPLGHLHEIGGEALEAETGALAAGFVAGLLGRLPSALPIIWISPCEDLYLPGLYAYGVDPSRLILVRSRDDPSTLAAMEVALRGGGLAAVVAEAGRLDRIASRRLQLACLDRGVTGFVLRRWPYGRQRPYPEATASVTRWLLAPLPSAIEAGEPGPFRWRVALIYARGGHPGAWIVEATETEEPRDDATDTSPYPFRVVAELAYHTA